MMNRVLLLMDHKENRRLLAERLATRYALLPDETDQGIDAAYDLGILDGTALDRLTERIQARKHAEEPMFLPFLLVTSRQQVGFITRHLWRSIDEVIHSPIVPVELQARTEVLLRVRRQAVELHEASRQRLAELVKELSQANRYKDEFLATLAHELRNPLAPIRNGLELLRRAWGNAFTVEQARNMMDRQLKQLVRLVDDLLDVSRITRGKLELRKERVELAAVVHSAVETALPLIKASGHQLTVRLPPESIFLDADFIRLAQVLSNLLNNAAKYTERDGHIWLTAEQQGAEIILTVRDTGVGIPVNMLNSIFEMFTQVDRSLERSQGGLGIGLTLVQRLVQMHGGRVAAHSAGPGHGSEFVVHLPAAASPSQKPQRSDGDGHKSTTPSPHRVLVVDDIRDSANSLSMMLQIMGNEVLTAYDGLEAVHAAASFRPDVVFLDIGMPKLNGYDAARRIREQPWSKDMVLIALTGYGGDEDKRRSKEAGFNYHFVKPVDADTIERLLAGLPVSPA